MSGKHRSIGERLTRARSRATVIEIAEDWAGNWRRQQHEAVHAVFAALDRDDLDTIYATMLHLNDLTHKGFAGLDRVIERLGDPEH